MDEIVFGYKEENQMSEDVKEAENTVSDKTADKGAEIEADIENSEKKYTAEDVLAQIKPLSENKFIRFFQKPYRKWLNCWYGFCDRHEKLSQWVYKLFFFCVFSMSVTIYQYIVMTFLPLAFESLNTGAVGWPNIVVGDTGVGYSIFGDAKGWGYFIAFEIAVFTAQCINFPLQRNITYRSHGNPWYQAMWYLIGWVLVSVFTNALWGICNVYITYAGWPDALAGLVKTVLTAGISMVIFFFIFMVIFPDNNKMAKNARAKYEKLKSASAPEEKLEKALKKAEEWERKALLSNTEAEYSKAVSQASGKAMQYAALIAEAEKAETEEAKAAALEKSGVILNDAFAAIAVKEEKEAAYNAARA